MTGPSYVIVMFDLVILGSGSAAFGAALKAAEGGDDRAIAAALSVGRATVERLRQRCVAEGLGALEERPRPGTPPQREEKAAARLSAAAWSDAPEGRKRWPLHVLADRVVARGLAAAYA